MKNEKLGMKNQVNIFFPQGKFFILNSSFNLFIYAGLSH